MADFPQVVSPSSSDSLLHQQQSATAASQQNHGSSQNANDAPHLHDRTDRVAPSQPALIRRLSRTRSMSYSHGLGLKLPDFEVVKRKQVEDVREELTNHVTADADAIHNEPIDLEMMLYQVQKRNTKKSKCIELVFYIFFLIFVTMYCFLFKNITGGFWVHESTKVRCIVLMLRIFFMENHL